MKFKPVTRGQKVVQANVPGTIPRNSKGPGAPPFKYDHYNSMYHYPPADPAAIAKAAVSRKNANQASNQEMPNKSKDLNRRLNPKNKITGIQQRVPPISTKEIREKYASSRGIDTRTSKIDAAKTRNRDLQFAQEEVIRAVGYRESLLLELNGLVLNWPTRRQSAVNIGTSRSSYPEAVRILKELSSDLRESGLRCVEKVVAWVLSLDPDADQPTPFLWNGEDYLLKMYTDLDFVYEVIGKDALRIGNFCKGNPLLLSKDELHGRGMRAQLGRAHAAGIVILDIVRRNKKGVQKDTVHKEFSTKTADAEELASKGPKSSSRLEENGKTGHVSHPGAGSIPSADQDGRDIISNNKGEQDEETYEDDAEEEDLVDEEGGKRGDGPEKMTEAGPTSEKGGKTVRNYELLEVLGEGSYGIVYKAKDTRSGNMVALKKFKENEEEDEELRDYISKTQLRERQFLLTLKHKNIINMIEDFEMKEDASLHLVFEILPENCLDVLNRHPKGLRLSAVKIITKQLFEALEFCHRNHVVHRDVKPENLLIAGIDKGNISLKLCDFGTAREEWEERSSKTELTHYVGSRWYRAPELLASSTKYSKAVDVWAAGCIVGELISGNTLFEGKDETEVLGSMQTLLGPVSLDLRDSLITLQMAPEVVKSHRLPSRTWESSLGKKANSHLIDFLKGIIVYQSHLRLDTKDALEHAFLKESGNARPSATGNISQSNNDKSAKVWKVFIGSSEELGQLIRGLTSGEMSIDGWVLRIRDITRLLTEIPEPTLQEFIQLFTLMCSSEESLNLLDGLLHVVRSILEERVIACEHFSSTKYSVSLSALIEAVSVRNPAATAADCKCVKSCLTLASRLESKRKSITDAMRLEANIINRALTSVSSLLLAPTNDYKQKLKQLEQFCTYLGLPNILLYPETLGPTGKSLLLKVKMMDGMTKPVVVVGKREEMLSEVFKILRSLDLPQNNRHSNRTQYILSPYFKSAYGEKVVNGVRVEEGEGLGLRKELFRLVSYQMQEKYRTSKGATFIISAEEGASAVKIRSEGKVVVEPGCMLSITADQQGPIKRIITRAVNQDRYYVDEPWNCSFEGREAELYLPANPVFAYHQPMECLWVNTTCRKTNDMMDQYRLCGALLALAIGNQCYVDLNLPELFFKIILAGNQYVTSLEDFMVYNPSLVQSMDKIRKLSEKDFKDLIRNDGLSEDATSREVYIKKSLSNSLYGEDIAWRFQMIRSGMSQIIPFSLIEELSVTEADLRVMICGPHDDGQSDFNFPDIFHISADQDLQKSSVWTIFWEVVSSFDALNKRKLLEFITGVVKLPAPGSEKIRINSPYIAFSLEEHKQLLQTLPQSHTCDNVLEIPNYWESLVAVWQSEHKGKGHNGPRASTQKHLENECAEIIKTKLLIAINNAQGYGLDQLHSQGSNPLERTVAPQGDTTIKTVQDDTYDNDFLDNIPSLDSGMKPEGRPSPPVPGQSHTDDHEGEYYDDDDFES